MQAKAKVITEISARSRNPTNVDMSGVRLGFPIAGRFAANGHYEPDACGLLITCTGGAEGKCIRFGYHPWASVADRTPMRDAYNACTRLVRADYASDGKGTTRNGQRIDLYDRFGIMKAADGPPPSSRPRPWRCRLRAACPG
jgi:ADYC domain